MRGFRYLDGIFLVASSRARCLRNLIFYKGLYYIRNYDILPIVATTFWILHIPKQSSVTYKFSFRYTLINGRLDCKNENIN